SAAPLLTHPLTLAIASITIVVAIGAAIWRISEPPRSVQVRVDPLAASAPAVRQGTSEIHDFIPELPAADVERSMEVYQRLGFQRVLLKGMLTNRMERDEEH